MPERHVELVPLVGHLAQAHIRGACGRQRRPGGRSNGIQRLLAGPGRRVQTPLGTLDLAEVIARTLIAQVLVWIADLALRGERYEQAARLFAASVGVRGQPDRSHPDVARIEQAARFAEATQEGLRASWRELVEATLAC